MGALASQWAAAGAKRLAEVRATPQTDLDRLISSFLKATSLPALDDHFAKHGKDFMGATPQVYLALFVAHIRRDDLRLFTALQPRYGSRMWYLVGMDNGFIAQYNESRRRYWSFYRSRDLDAHLGWVRGYWVEVKKAGDRWEAELWR